MATDGGERRMASRDERTGAAEVVARIPLHEERLTVQTQPIARGERQVRTVVESEEQTIRQPVTQDELVVERVTINRPLTERIAARYEGETLIIPIIREVLVVEKRLMLVEEVRIGTRPVTEEQTLQATVRRTRVLIDSEPLPEASPGEQTAPTDRG